MIVLKVLFFGRSKKEEVWEHDYILNDILDGREVSTSFLYLDDIRNSNCDFDVFIYSARDPNNYPWGYMPTFDNVLECVKKTKSRIVIQLSDEFWYEDLQIHNTIADHCELFLRQYHHKNYSYNKNTKIIPLGYYNGFSSKEKIVPINEKKYFWSFVGEKKSDRIELIECFDKIQNNYCHLREDNDKISQEELKEIYLNSIFVPCGRGYSSLYVMRIYEACIHGAIPIVVGSEEEIKETFCFEENPPWLFFDSWKNAATECEKLLTDIDKLQELQDNILYWWKNRIGSIRDNVYDVIINKKLKDFPSVNCISITPCFERRKLMYENFKKYGIKNYKTHIYERYDDSKHKVEHETLELDPSGRGPVTSHLKTIKSWYENTNEPYTIIFEDDIDFSTLKFWTFNWKDFFDRIPKNWKIVQLCLVREKMFNFYFEDTGFKLRDRCFDDWSGCAYLISREHAKKLVENYLPEDTFYLEYKGSDRLDRSTETYAYSWLLPQIENLIYTNFDSGGVYCFPLFCENVKFSSTWNTSVSYVNLDSNNKVMKWWSEEGKNYSVNQLFQ